MAHPETKGFRSLAWAVAIGLVLATVCNGASLYLKRTGLMDVDAYQAYWSFHCGTLPLQSSPEAVGPRCCALATPAQIAQLEASAGPRGERAQTRFVYRTTGAELALKLVKDVFGIALFTLSLILLLREPVLRPALQKAWPVGLLLAYAGAALGASLVLYEPLVALAGARSFMFLGLALLGLWLVPHMALLASAAAALLAVQVFLMPFEMLRGVHLHGHFHLLPLAGRLSGTLVAPNTLGVFAVSALAFYYAFVPHRRWLWLVALMALALVLLSGSGTGMVGFGLFLIGALINRLGAHHRRFTVIAGSIALLALAVFLPELMGRPRLFESLWGRIDGLGSMLAGKAFWEILFGSGLGVDTNTAGMLVRMLGAESFPRYSQVPSGAAESMLTSLLTQLGLVGALLFYGALAWAAVRDHQARMFYAIVALCSLTLQVTELFPVNFLLGVALAHSVAVAPQTRLMPGHG